MAKVPIFHFWQAFNKSGKCWYCTTRMSSLYFVLSVWSWKISNVPFRKLSSLLYMKRFERQNNIKCLDMFYSPFTKSIPIYLEVLLEIIMSDPDIRSVEIIMSNELIFVRSVRRDSSIFSITFMVSSPKENYIALVSLNQLQFFSPPSRKKGFPFDKSDCWTVTVRRIYTEKKDEQHPSPFVERESGKDEKKPKTIFHPKHFMSFPACLSVCLSVFRFAHLSFLLSFFSPAIRREQGNNLFQ